MSKIKDLTSQKFNRLTVIEQNGRQSGKVVWKCQCDCGNIINVIGSNLTSNKVKSCGCLRREKQSKWGASTLIDIVGQKYLERERKMLLIENTLIKYITLIKYFPVPINLFLYQNGLYKLAVFFIYIRQGV